jgi:hypothetical protein
MEIDKAISVYTQEWNNNFGSLKFEDDFSFYYYSLYLGDSPVYRISINNTDRAFDIYKRNDYWYISENFISKRVLSFSHVKNSLHYLIPPMGGWSDNYFSKYMKKIIIKYHYLLNNLTIEFRWWEPKIHFKTNNNMKNMVITFLMIFKRYSINVPNEIIFLILNNLRAINF